MRHTHENIIITMRPWRHQRRDGSAVPKTGRAESFAATTMVMPMGRLKGKEGCGQHEHNTETAIASQPNSAEDYSICCRGSSVTSTRRVIGVSMISSCTRYITAATHLLICLLRDTIAWATDMRTGTWIGAEGRRDDKLNRNVLYRSLSHDRTLNRAS